MLKIESKNLSFMAACVIDDEVVARFNSNYYGSNIDFNYSIENAMAHLNHQAKADADFDEFKATVMTAVAAMTEDEKAIEA
jgi:hypothetical protein